MESRPTSVMIFTASFTSKFLWCHHAWFGASILVTVVADGMYQNKDSFARQPLNLLDLFLVVAGLSNQRFLVSLNALRVLRVLSLLANLKGFEILKEILALLRKSGRVVFSILVVMFTCLVFFSLLTSNLVVRLLLTFRPLRELLRGAGSWTLKEATE